MKNNIELGYLEDCCVNYELYDEFIKSYYSQVDYERHKKRDKWYAKEDKKKTLLAIVDGKIVGQSCAFKEIAVIYGKEEEWWWGVDVFIKEEYRGLGIGKMMQSRLSTDLQNFSSAQYSRVNGIVKQKVGQKQLFPIAFSFYPTSRFCGVFIELLFAKFFHKNISIKTKIPNLYYNINSKGLKEYDIKREDNLESLIQTLELSMQDYDFFIKRDYDFFRWKYIQNPSISYRQLNIYKRDVLIAVIFVSDPYDTRFVKSNIKGVKLLDYYILNKNEISVKKVIALAMRHFKESKETIDGVLALEKVSFRPHITYPYPSTPLLTTYRGKVPRRSYISYIDQDMEQMF